MYQHDPPSTPDPPERFRKFAGDELKDFLLAKALECFACGWSLPDVQDRVADWHILKAEIGAFLSDDDVAEIVARAEKVAREILPPHEPAHEGNVVYLKRARPTDPDKSRTITIDRPGYTGTPMEVNIHRG